MRSFSALTVIPSCIFGQNHTSGDNQGYLMQNDTVIEKALTPPQVGVFISIQQESSLKRDGINNKNRPKFAALKALNLPVGQYAITGSGALGIRNLRPIGDIDIIVTSDLWNILEAKYGVIDKNSVRKIVFPGSIVEALGENSFYTEEKDKDAPTIQDRIANAEIIEGLPFESLEHVLYYKRKMGREKDKQDIKMIEMLQGNKQKQN